MFKRKHKEDDIAKETNNYTRGYKHMVKTENGFIQKGITVELNHPCYNKVKAIIDEYEKNKEITKNLSIWNMSKPSAEFIWNMYLDARDLEDQTLAKEIADKYGIDYNQPVLTNAMMKKLECEINNIKKFEEEKSIKNIVIEVLKEKGLVDK